MKQMWQVFQMTRRYDSSAQWLMLLGFLLPVLAGLGLALWLSEGNGFTIALWIIAGALAGLLIAQRGAGHVAPLDDGTMAELQDAMVWMLPPSE